MRIENDTIVQARKKEGDGLLVTLLFVAAAAFAVGTFWATDAFIASSDTIRRFVPRNAVAYLHASGRAPVEALLSSSAQMPSGVRPDEIAVFAVPGDDALRWGTILAWRPTRRPTADELRALDERGAETLDLRHFLIGDGALATSAKVAEAAEASLADDRDKDAALDLMASVSAVQLYADPISLIPHDLVLPLAGLSEEGLPAIVAGIDLRNGSVAARVLTVEHAAGRMSPLGYGATTRRSRTPAIEGPEAAVVIAETSPTIEFGKLFVGEPRRGDHPSPGTLLDASDALRSDLASSYALWLRPAAAGTDIDFLFRFHAIGPDRTVAAVARYFAAAEPARAVMTLPDGDQVIEFNLDEQPQDDQGGHVDKVFVSRGRDMKRGVVVGGDGHGGSLVASSVRLLSEYRSGNVDESRGSSCPVDGFRSVILLNDPLQAFSAMPSMDETLHVLNIGSLTLGLTVDSEIRICGQTKSGVDNSSR